jgi:hypothetical protein
MASQEEKIAIVKRAVSAFAKAEKACQDISEAMTDLQGIYKEGASAGMAKGGFVVKEIAGFKTIIGDVGDMEAKIFAAHERGTEIAKANDADTALPTGYVTVMSGGR